jgi:hypothetical protein
MCIYLIINVITENINSDIRLSLEDFLQIEEKDERV